MQLTKNTQRGKIRAALIVFVIAIGGALVGISYWRSLKNNNGLPEDDVTHKIWWRTEVYVRKATGGIPDLTWSDLWLMTRTRGGFGMEKIAEGMSVAGSVTNSYTSPEDIKTGASIFGKKCAICHGINGVGLSAPPLNSSGHKHGDSNLAIYKVLRDGIPDTPMAAPALTPVERWQMVGYISDLMNHGTNQSGDEKIHLNINVSSEQIRSAGSRSDEWLTYSGSLDGHRYTPLNEITAANVSKLRLRWVHQYNFNGTTVEATPLVVDGTMFVTEPPSNVVAIDAKTGETIWRYDRKVATKVFLCCGPRNRGLAVLGQKLFLATVDGYLVAIDANTGKMIWETQVADYTDGYSMTGAPLIVNQSVVVGVAGGEYGIRGFLASYDSNTGKQQWKFNTIPNPGEPGHETWQNDSWKTGGGPTWVTGSYDPSLDLLYWGVGNPSAEFSGDNRPGDNLYTDSVLAIHPSTGKLAWYFQFTPHDEHDWDATQTPILTDVSINGVSHKAICWFNRNGFYYVLDRVTGQFLTGVPFVEQNWAKGLDSNGRPIPADAGGSSDTGRLTRPAFSGGTNWQNSAIDVAKGLVFVHATDGASVFTKSPHVGPRELDGNMFLGSSASTPDPPAIIVRALDVATGAKKWEHFSPPINQNLSYAFSGLLATGGNVVFGASGGYAFALDSATGRELWSIPLGGDTRAAPISFTLDGHQVVAISGGSTLLLFGL